MSSNLRMLAEFVSANGYDVWVQSTQAGSVFGIFHALTDREAVYGYDERTERKVFKQIAMQYCTEEQLDALEEAGPFRSLRVVETTPPKHLA